MGEVLIWAPKPFTRSQVNVKFSKGDKQVSVSLDDSCEAFEHLICGEIRCFLAWQHHNVVDAAGRGVKLT